MITEETVAEGLKAMRGPDEFIDPVCKMTVTKEGAAATYEYKGETYYFCNKACKDSFAKNPQKYLSQ
jgi:Cu+-exporting ATPase